MEYFFPNQFDSLLLTLAVGIASGIIYDVILIKRAAFGFSRIGMFVGDVLFCAAFYILLTLCVLKANYGMLRWYELLLPFFSFMLYRCSISQITVRLGTAVLSFTVKAVGFTVRIIAVKPVLLLYRHIKAFMQKVMRKRRYFKQKRCSERIRTSIIHDAERGFYTDGK